jgi:hypothetical protein
MRSRFVSIIFNICSATMLKIIYIFGNKLLSETNLHSQYRILQETKKEFVNCVTSKCSIQKLPSPNFLAVKQHVQDIQLCLWSQIYVIYEEYVSIKSRNFPCADVAELQYPCKAHDPSDWLCWRRYVAVFLFFWDISEKMRLKSFR